MMRTLIGLVSYGRYEFSPQIIASMRSHHIIVFVIKLRGITVLRYELPGPVCQILYNVVSYDLFTEVLHYLLKSIRHQSPGRIIYLIYPKQLHR